MMQVTSPGKCRVDKLITNLKLNNMYWKTWIKQAVTRSSEAWTPKAAARFVAEDCGVDFETAWEYAVECLLKDLMKCSLDELLTERQLAINSGNIERYRECNELISTMCNNKKIPTQ